MFKNVVYSIWLDLYEAVEYTDFNFAEGYDTKQSDGEVSVMLGPWGIRSTPSLPLLSGPLWLNRTN